MSKARQIETCAHARPGSKNVVWFLTTGTVVLCEACSKTAVRTVRAVVSWPKKGKAR